MRYVNRLIGFFDHWANSLQHRSHVLRKKQPSD
jgi:hypothetical protein